MNKIKITLILFISSSIIVFFSAKLLALSEKSKYSSIYFSTRLNVVQQQLDESVDGYVLLAGDSNAELHGSSSRVCDAVVVNAGLSGTTTRNYNQFLSKLRFASSPRAIVLTIGTNDLGFKKKPMSNQASSDFEASISNIISTFKLITDKVIVTHIPPLDHNVERTFDGNAAVDYSRIIHMVCANLGCRSIDPFADLRDGESGFGLPGVNRDGLHLAHYKPVLSKIADSICSNSGH